VECQGLTRWRTRRASEGRGSSLTLGKNPMIWGIRGADIRVASHDNRRMHPEADSPLPFPRHVRVTDNYGRVSEEYDIPLSAKKKVLQEMYLFQDCPELTDTLFDLHAEKKFKVVDFKVVREGGRNYLVSPYYYESGGTMIDWMPAYFGDEE
jgi:hypothetical protein